MHVVRWGQSAYETDGDLGSERQGAEGLGCTWSAWRPTTIRPPDLERCDVLVVTSKVKVDGEVVQRLPRGSLVLTTTSGYDHIDLSACAARGIPVGRLPNARRDAVVEHALASLIGLLRRQDALLGAAREGRWARGELPALAPRALSEATILVLGCGVIGRRMSEVLTVLGAHVLGVDPAGVPGTCEAVSLEEGLPRADAVTVHCSLTPSSRGLLDDGVLSLLPAHAVVVNTARGAIVDVDAAVARVRAGQLGGISLDVFPEEPWPRLREQAGDRVWLFPHGAGFTHDLGARVARGVVETLGLWIGERRVFHPVNG